MSSGWPQQLKISDIDEVVDIDRVTVLESSSKSWRCLATLLIILSLQSLRVDIISRRHLIVGGCGRAEGLLDDAGSLAKLKALPPRQKYCTHEYTLANLAFAQKVEPTMRCWLNMHGSGTSRARFPQYPQASKLSAINLFFANSDEIIANLVENRQTAALPADVFAAVRGWKDEGRALLCYHFVPHRAQRRGP